MLWTAMPCGPSGKIVSSVWMIGPTWHSMPTSFEGFPPGRLLRRLALQHATARNPPGALGRRVFPFHQQDAAVRYDRHVHAGDRQVGENLVVKILRDQGVYFRCSAGKLAAALAACKRRPALSSEAFFSYQAIVSRRPSRKLVRATNPNSSRARVTSRQRRENGVGLGSRPSRQRKATKFANHFH